MVRKVFSFARSHCLELVFSEVGLVAAKGHDHGEGRTYWSSFPVVENRDHGTAFSLQIEGLTTVLRMVIDNNGRFYRHLVSGLHGIGI